MLVIIVGGISLGVVFLLGCVGEIITEKSGHLNLGIPGIMCMGAAGGCYAVALYMNSLPSADRAIWFLVVLVAVLGAAIVSAFGGLIYAVLTVSLRANQNVTGLALTTFGAGFSQFVMDTYVDRTRFSVASKIIRRSILGNADWAGSADGVNAGGSDQRAFLEREHLHALRGGVGALVELAGQIFNRENSGFFAAGKYVFVNVVHLRFGKNGQKRFAEIFLGEPVDVVALGDTQLGQSREAERFAQVLKDTVCLFTESVFFLNKDAFHKRKCRC